MKFTKTVAKQQYLNELQSLSLEELKEELFEISSNRDHFEINYNIFKGSIYHEVVRSALGFLSKPEECQDVTLANSKFKDILERGFMYSIWALTEPYKCGGDYALKNSKYTKEEVIEVISNIFDDIKSNNYEYKIIETAKGVRDICKYALWYYFDLDSYKDSPDIMFPDKHSDIETKMNTVIRNIIGVFDVAEQ